MAGFSSFGSAFAVAGRGGAVLARMTSSVGKRLGSAVSPRSRASMISTAATPKLCLGGWTVVSGTRRSSPAG